MDFNKHTRVTFCFSHRCTHFFVFVNISVIYSVSQNLGGGGKLESNRWLDGRRARWPTMPPVARNWGSTQMWWRYLGLMASQHALNPWYRFFWAKRWAVLFVTATTAFMIYHRRIFFPPLITAKPLIHIAQRNAYVSGFVLYYLCYCSSCPPKPPPYASTLPAFCDHNSDRWYS